MEVTRARIWSSNQPFAAHAESIRALLFGVLVGLTRDTVTEHLSDLYHDASWIQSQVNGPITFYFGVRAHGTGIGQDLHMVSYVSDIVYEVRLTVEGHGAWYVETRKS